MEQTRSLGKNLECNLNAVWRKEQVHGSATDTFFYQKFNLYPLLHPVLCFSKMTSMGYPNQAPLPHDVHNQYMERWK